MQKLQVQIPRDNRLDSIKGFLIILVILGHIISKCGTGTLNSGAYTFIYTFHMPLFILLSGYFTKLKNDNKSFWQGLLNIAIPLGIFQIINIIIQFAFDHQIGLSVLFVPRFTLWYLLSLIYWRIMIQYSLKPLLNKPLLYLTIAFIISIISGLMPYGGFLSVQRTLNFFPFFLYGYYMRNEKVSSKLWNNYISYGLIFATLLLIAFNFYPDNSNSLLRGKSQYDLAMFPSKVYMLFCSFVTSLSFYNIIKGNRLLTIIGKDSLLYYLYHGIIILYIVLPLVQSFSLPQSFPFMLLYCATIVVMIYVMSKIRLFRWLTNPIANK